MTTPVPPRLKDAMTEILTDSIQGSLPDSTPRTLHGRTAFPDKATVVVGMRRVGKTTLLHQWRRERLAQGHPRDTLPFIGFEDERLIGLEGHHLGYLIEAHERLSPNPGVRTVWSFDEIQVVPGWEKFIRRLLDSNTCEVMVSGSSASMLSSEIATSLRGRAWEVPLFPFSFAEVLSRGTPPTTRTGRERALLTWLQTGGFPETMDVDEESRLKLLRDYVDVAILRDVVERHQVTQITALRSLSRHLMAHAGSHFSVEKFHKVLKSQGIPAGRDTLHELLAHLEDAFLVRLVWMEADSDRKRMVNPRKCYPVDPGLISIFERSGKANLGHALETAVLIELERRGLACTWVRTPMGLEIDFLARSITGGETLLQVCADASDPDTADREIRALVDARAIHPEARRLLVVATADGLPAELPAGIECMTAAQWFLSAL